MSKCYENYTCCGFMPNYTAEYELDNDGVKHSVHAKPRLCLYSGMELDWNSECPYFGQQEKKHE